MAILKNIAQALFSKTRYVAITLFSQIDKIEEALITVAHERTKMFQVTFYVGRTVCPIGWAYVHPIGWTYRKRWDEGGCWFCKAMREETHVYSHWKDGHPGPWEETVVDNKWVSVDQGWNTHVQFTALYKVEAASDKAAAERAFQCLLDEEYQPSEWFDRSPDNRWAKRFQISL